MLHKAIRYRVPINASLQIDGQYRRGELAKFKACRILISFRLLAIKVSAMRVNRLCAVTRSKSIAAAFAAAISLLVPACFSVVISISFHTRMNLRCSLLRVRRLYTARVNGRRRPAGLIDQQHQYEALRPVLQPVQSGRVIFIHV